eukprot:5638468-Ditylum_brightwellii.AAC.1
MSAQISNSFHIEDQKGIDDMVGQIAGNTYKTILQAKYEKANLDKKVEGNCPQLNPGQRTWKNNKYDIKLKPGVMPYHGRPYSIPRAYKQQLRVK